jgi:hypothetical protein
MHHVHAPVFTLFHDSNGIAVVPQTYSHAPRYYNCVDTPVPECNGTKAFSSSFCVLALYRLSGVTEYSIENERSR